MNRHIFGKNLDVFPQNSQIFLKIVMLVLKIVVTLKSFLATQFFSHCLNQLSFLKLSLLFNNYTS